MAPAECGCRTEANRICLCEHDVDALLRNVDDENEVVRTILRRNQDRKNENNRNADRRSPPLLAAFPAPVSKLP